MNEMTRIVGTGLIGGILSIFIRREKPEFAVFIALATSIAISVQIISGIGEITEKIKELANQSGVDIKYFSVCIKSIGIAYISQFTAEILRDCGEGAIAAKVEAAGKLSILMLTIPIMESFLSLCIRLVNAI